MKIFENILIIFKFKNNENSKIMHFGNFLKKDFDRYSPRKNPGYAHVVYESFISIKRDATQFGTQYYMFGMYYTIVLYKVYSLESTMY